jgi:hypothetical protein
MGAAMGGGIAALQKKDILQGALMGGVGGALGGAFMPGVAGAVGGEAVGTATSSGLGSLGSTTAGAANLFGATGAAGAAGTAGAAGAGVTGTTAGGFLGGPGEILAGATGSGGGSLGASPGLFGGSGGIGNFLSQNKYALAGGALGGMMAPGQEPPSPEQGNIRDYTFSQERNPLFGQPGQSAFTNQQFTPGAVTSVEDYTAANGGIIALAEGGQPGIEMQRYERPVRQMAPEVAAYNQQLMERANQQYNVNLRPAPNQVPGSAGYIAPPSPMAPAASSGESLSGLRFNPVTQQFEGEFLAPGDKKKRPLFDMDDEEPQNSYNFSSGDSGNANGGLMSSYAAGGISSLGSYSDGGQLLKGPGNGTSDSIPAVIGNKQPARLADGEFVVPARIVSELGNGSTDAGAKQLYGMMDRIQKNRKKTVGKGKVAVDAKSRKLLPA